ncbi:FUSC family protein [Actinomadura opuntiae]|uniref:FUSC family protein n=1 Tax=Actinomadura sp. OS1-43 TaxID=604315 RepID=UPI00255ABE23|nr:FUSC family protein [Actinomadura sp. OS1-43]MDL4815876.1 FUSC family protein [Actinomadura sp. OS1-43]
MAAGMIRGLGAATAPIGVAAATMAAVLASFGSALLLEHAAHLHADAVMQAVVLSVTLSRGHRGARPSDRLVGFAVMPAVALVSVGLGILMRDDPFAGDAAFAALVTSGVWIRRFGPRFTKAGTLMMLPAIALLVIPHGEPGAPSTHLLWAPVVALIPYFWVTAVQVAVERPWRTGRVEAAPAPAPAPNKRLPASTRMAAQMGVALCAAFAIGHLLFPDHWSWVVLTAFIVCNGARGRGDALHKGLLRALGAAGGTVLAALASGVFAPRDPNAVALIFVVLGVAAWLRQRSYAYWAGGVTAALSLLYGYFGQAAAPLLQTRLEAILVGSAIGVAAVWFVLPFRTSDVLRRRTSASLAALTDLLKGDPHAHRRFENSVAEMDDLYGPLRLHRLVTRARPHPADVIDVLRETVPHVRALRPGIEGLRANVGAVRRAVARRHDGTPYRPLPPEEDATAHAIDAALARIHEVYAQPVKEPEREPKHEPESPEKAHPAG